MESIDELIRLRDEAIEGLLAEREQLQRELEVLTAKLQEIDQQLTRLGHATRPAVSSTRSRRRQRRMEDGQYQGTYQGQVYDLHVQDGVGTVGGIDGEFTSLSGAAEAIKLAVTGRHISAQGPRFWKRVS